MKREFVLDNQLVTQAEHVFQQLGISSNNAVTQFYQAVVEFGGLPFGSKTSDDSDIESKIRQDLADIPAVDLNQSEEARREFFDED
ncbi:hypothetical protein AYR62_00515 [Secundilactobacillus paracollinoides]|uniref:Damage-inducible protein J n=1 Tax=Secundilactobacillus paracollinoides TaxID=240427 RepID=A0A1B2IVM2_9LACO|nr:hypothetical protein [Secundilactobacillus paracollinoides]ANZ60286.1 hypothetical protein AYR61_02240 [Secundilactobacillus paracollinoides]ANZ62728.1 hypothetical protein AYR62_00515 [Secundilactobacillus paracollinoides]ANZ66116.1 hypothetical protein AYR63_02440 [Secundilactobacillus paracollinoides]